MIYQGTLEVFVILCLELRRKVFRTSYLTRRGYSVGVVRTRASVFFTNIISFQSSTKLHNFQ